MSFGMPCAQLVLHCCLSPCRSSQKQDLPICHVLSCPAYSAHTASPVMTVLAAAFALAALTALRQLEQPELSGIMGKAICTELPVHDG